jgi:hypothetical protein
MCIAKKIGCRKITKYCKKWLENRTANNNAVKGIGSRKFAMLLLIPLESYSYNFHKKFLQLSYCIPF